MPDSPDRVAITALRVLIETTIEALEDAEGCPLPWPTQKIIREQVARAFEVGRDIALGHDPTGSPTVPATDEARRFLPPGTVVALYGATTRPAPPDTGESDDEGEGEPP